MRLPRVEHDAILVASLTPSLAAEHGDWGSW